MKGIEKVLLVWLLVLGSVAAGAQVKVQTVVPRQQVVVGNAFQVQYVVQDLQNFVELQPPDFGDDFRLVSGPGIYKGSINLNGVKIPIQNYIYTVVPLHQGRLQVQGAAAIYNTGKQQSAPAFVNCINAVAPAASNTLATLPNLWQNKSKDLERRVQQQLFIKADINKKTCFIGEPIVATFTLYSALHSASEVVKNPGFYGFSVVDMPQATVPQQGEVQGYIKHLLRKVQLYPMQAGKLVIDEMTVNSLVAYLDTATGDEKETTFLTASNPVVIEVKALPIKEKPDNFTSAVGELELAAELESASIASGEVGRLTITISGKGNFLQMDAPEVKWPAGVEGFEPEVKEVLRKDAVPVQGERQYSYTFTTDSTGTYVIPPVHFSYFNPASKTYKTLTTDTLNFTVVRKSKLRTFFSRTKEKGPKPLWNYVWIAAGAVLVGGALFFLYKKQKGAEKFAASPAAAPEPSFSEKIKALQAADGDKEAFSQLQQTLYLFLKKNYGIAATAKASLQQQLQATAISEAHKKEMVYLLQECEKAQYFSGTAAASFAQLQQGAAALVQQLEKA